MRKLTFYWFLLLTTFLLSSCEVIGDIFKTGFWIGVIAVVVVVGLIFWIISKFRR